jgi:hypothetical protein
MRTTLAAVCSLILLPGAVVAQERAGFLLRAGDDTASVEQFTRMAERVDGRLLLGKRIPITYQGALNADGTMRRLVVSVYQPNAPAEAPPRQVVALDFLRDSLSVETRTADSTHTERIATRPGALPYHPQLPILSLLEQIVRRARSIGGSRVQVPVFLLGTGARTVDAVVEFSTADSAIVALGNIEIRLAVDAPGRVLGGRAQRDQIIERLTSVPDRVVAAQAPDYSAPAGAPYRAEEVRIPTRAGHVLVGTLTTPAGRAGPVPAAVTITGSSPQDRDGNSPSGGPYRIFRQVADTLARRGIAVLRLDDRGTGQSTGDLRSATTADRAEDIRAALSFLRAREGIDSRRLLLVGLSEGGVIAPMIADADTSLRGIVLLAAPASTGRHLLEYQGRYRIEQNPSIPPEKRDSVYRAEAARAETRLAEDPWLRYFMTYDPLQAARRVRRVPVLILQVTTDRNVPPADAGKLESAFRSAGNRDVTVRMFPGVNHIFLRDPDGNPRRYDSLPSFEVVPEVLGAISNWAAAHVAR